MSRRERERSWERFVRRLIGFFGAAIIGVSGWAYIVNGVHEQEAIGGIATGIIIMLFAIFAPLKWVEHFGP